MGSGFVRRNSCTSNRLEHKSYFFGDPSGLIWHGFPAFPSWHQSDYHEILSQWVHLKVRQIEKMNWYMVQGPSTLTVFFLLPIRAPRWCDRIGFLGFNYPQDMDILLFDDNFLLTQPIWSQYLQKPEIKNFTLTHDFHKLKLLLVKISFLHLFYCHIIK